MSGRAWQQANEAYLTASLAWLRGVLEACASEGTSETARQVAALAEARLRAQTADSLPALLILAQRLGLSPFERDVLLLAAAPSLDTRIAFLCAQAQGDPTKAYPTFALALSLFPEASWQALSPHAPLRHWRLLEIHQGQAQPLTTAALAADERLVAYLKGLNHLDERLLPFMAPPPRSMGSQSLPASLTLQRQTLEEALSRQPAPVIQLLGRDGPGKLGLAASAAEAVGLTPFRLLAEALPHQGPELEALARLWERESRLMPLALLIDATEVETGSPTLVQVARFLDRVTGPALVVVREALSLGRPTVPVDVAKPLPAEQRRAWGVGLAARDLEPEPLSGLLASQFNLDWEQIQGLLRTLPSPNSDPAEAESLLWRGCLQITRPRLESLAQRLPTRAAWKDLVLPPQELDLLHQIVGQFRGRATVYDAWGFGRRQSRGLGICALFCGESGTGKTLGAEVLAGAMGLDLYRIDLSAVVSKYIGETSKHLRRLFDAAEDGGAILFFDEADALFGKRSEVRDSHDRYANIEVNYLLQRIEAYSGLAILATNLKGALDTAFTRRMRFVVQFPFPGTEERRALWELAFPAETPLAELDWERLAQWNLTGASIHAIALHAAFLAAREESGVGMGHVLEAARTEFRKLDRPLPESEFRLAPNGHGGAP